MFKCEKIPVISFSDTISDPGTVMIEPFYTIVTNGAMWSPGGPKQFAGEAIFQLDSLKKNYPLWLNKFQQKMGLFDKKNQTWGQITF